MASISFLSLMDIFLEFTHISLVLFIVFGWLYPRFREVHLVVLLLTGFSWLIFSKGNAFGNCILTDLHWQILRKLGEIDLPETYAQYMFERIAGLNFQKATALTITRSFWLLSLILSSVLVLRKYFGEPRLKVTDYKLNRMIKRTKERILLLITAVFFLMLSAACEKDEDILFIGQSYQGGIIGYMLQKGDPGYEKSHQHGLIIAPYDQTSAMWGCDGIKIVTSMEIGTGQSNTSAILNACQEPGIAARICDDLVLEGFDDWYLPSDAELIMICMNKSKIGGLSGSYWSSSESSGENWYAWQMEAFDNACSGGTDTRWAVRKVRAVRSF